MSDNYLKHGSLFSGYGGLDMAVEAVWPEARTVFHSEYDPAASLTLAHRYPEVPNLGDITKIDWGLVDEVYGPIDILSGGSPCQDLSTAGRRAGMTEGTRSNLWVNMREGIDALRPRYVVWENVRGALSAPAAGDLEWTRGLLDERERDQHPTKEDPSLRALGRVLGDLADLGYDAQWVGLRASDVGAPHQRFRVFLLAHTDQLGPHRSGSAGLEARREESPYGGAPAADGGGLDSRPRSDERSGPGGSPSEGPASELGRHRPVRAAAQPESFGRQPRGSEPTGLEGRLRTPGSAEHAPDTDSRRRELERGESAKLRHADGCGSADSARDQREPATLDAAGRHGGAVAPDADHPGRCQQWRAESAAPTHTAFECGGGTDWGKYESAIRRWERVTGHPVPRPVDERRRLSPRFAEWMMGLTYGWLDVPGVSRADQLRQAGNGVVPQQAIAGLLYLRDLQDVM